MEEFSTILTSAGEARVAALLAGGTVSLAFVAVGDGLDGGYYEPAADQTALKNEKWRGAITSVAADPGDATQVVVSVYIPPSVGGFWIREAGIFTNEATPVLFAVAKLPAREKAALESGSAIGINLKLYIDLSSTKVSTPVGTWHAGDTEPPTNDIGAPGDFYLCKQNPYNLYGPKKSDNTWDVALKSALRGPAGPAGSPYKAYDTLALATADIANIPANSNIWVNADPTPANIGTWMKSAGALVQSPYDRVALVEQAIAGRLGGYVPNTFPGGNLANAGAGSTFWNSSPDNALVKPLVNAYLNGLGLNYAFDLTAGNGQRGNFIQIPACDFIQNGDWLAFSMYVYSSDGVDYGTERSLYLKNAADATLQIMYATAYNQVAANVRQYYFSGQVTVNPPFGRVLIGFRCDTARTANINVTGFAFAWGVSKIDVLPSRWDMATLSPLGAKPYVDQLPKLLTRMGSAELASNYRDNIAALKSALLDDFHQRVNIRFIGDSITWGMTVTGQGVQDPRTHALTDPRNNLTSPCYVNLLRDYIGKKYAAGTVQAGIPGNAAIAGCGYYQKTCRIGFSDPAFVKKQNNGNLLTKTIGTNALFFLGEYMDLLYNSAYNIGVEFDFYGDSLTLHYWQLPGYGQVECFIDGVSQGIVDANGVNNYDAQKTWTMALGQHHIRIQNNNAVNPGGFRATGFTWTKTVQVANDGLIGTATHEWLPGTANLDNSVQAADEFVFINLGTNDRSTTQVPLAPTKVLTNLIAIATHLRDTHLKKVILIAPNQVTQNESAYYFTQGQVAANVEKVGQSAALPVINCWGITGLADGIHPNDAGHALYYQQIVKELGV